jgi:hypothetical protein
MACTKVLTASGINMVSVLSCAGPATATRRGARMQSLYLVAVIFFLDPHASNGVEGVRELSRHTPSGYEDNLPS